MDAPTPLRIVFCGTPAFGLPSLKRLLADSRFEIAAVVTQPDRPRGRGQEISASPVKVFALENNLKVFQPDRIGSESSRDFFMNISPDAVVIIAYGQIFPRSSLEFRASAGSTCTLLCSRNIAALLLSIGRSSTANPHRNLHDADRRGHGHRCRCC